MPRLSLPLLLALLAGLVPPGSAGAAAVPPNESASASGSTRFAPDVSASTGRSSTTKTRLLTICATSHPIAAAASAKTTGAFASGRSFDARSATATISGCCSAATRSLAASAAGLDPVDPGDVHPGVRNSSHTHGGQYCHSGFLSSPSMRQKRQPVLPRHPTPPSSTQI